MNRVYLGGTWSGNWNANHWRKHFIPMLNIDYFDPIVRNWTPECMAEEVRQRESCDFCLCVLTPMMTGHYATAEVTDDSNKRPGKTILVVLREDEGKSFTDSQWKSFNALRKLIELNGAAVFESLEDVAEFLNQACGGCYES